MMLIWLFCWMVLWRLMNNAGEVVLEQVLRNGLIVYGADSLEFKQFKMYRCVQIAEFNDYMNMLKP